MKLTCYPLWRRYWTRSSTEHLRILLADPKGRCDQKLHDRTAWHQTETTLYTQKKHSQRLIQTWPSRLLQPQAHSVGWWLLHCCPHQETPLKQRKCIIHSINRWTSDVIGVRTYCAVLLLGTHTLKHQLFLQNDFHPEIAAVTFTHTWVGAQKADINVRAGSITAKALELFRRVLPAMEWMRMLLITRLFGGGSCLLNLVFIIS